MAFTQDYLDDLLVRLAYHSSGIEGNTISLPETVSIILESSLPTSRKSIREFYEIENHRQAFAFMLSLQTDKSPLEMGHILEIHTLLVDRLQHDRGQFKKQQNAIVGAEFQTATPAETPVLMSQWLDNTIYRLERAEDAQACLEVLADTHIQFERIHPFSDGNGRVGRLLLMHLAMLYLECPVLIKQDLRADYMELLAQQNIKGLASLLAQSLTYEKERMTFFNT